MRGRDAIDTIRGYYYQFDYYILKLIELENDRDTVTMEQIEDVDIYSNDELVAVQCKYYEQTNYNHSVIAKPIRLMLRDYAKRKSNNEKIQYKIYAKYKSGYEKFPQILDVDFAKKHFFTYVEKGKSHILHEELLLDDQDLKDFLNKLDIDIEADEFDVQQKKIIKILKNIFNCSDFDSEYYYYSNALRIVKDISIKKDSTKRTLSKREFISKINTKKILFDEWYIENKGIKNYCAEVKKHFFTHINISPYERFFLIECDEKITNSEMASLIMKISSNWSRLSKRETNPFCPYIYIEGIFEKRLIEIKKILQGNNFTFIDGYDYLGADFFVNSMLKQANYYNQIKVKIINNINELNLVLQHVRNTKQIYQFYFNKPFYKSNQSNNIQIINTVDIKMMI